MTDVAAATVANASTGLKMLFGTVAFAFTTAEDLLTKLRDYPVNCGLDGTDMATTLTMDRTTFMQLWHWGIVDVARDAKTNRPASASCQGYKVIVTGTKFV